MFWAMIISASVVISGYDSKQACEQAAKEISVWHRTVCVPLPSNAQITVRGAR